MRTKYTISYFIKKFSAIPRKLWTTGAFCMDGQSCALGHCGQRIGHHTPEGDGLKRIFNQRSVSIFLTNDTKRIFPQLTPRGRILAALRLLRKSHKRTTV